MGGISFKKLPPRSLLPLWFFPLSLGLHKILTALLLLPSSGRRNLWSLFTPSVWFMQATSWSIPLRSLDPPQIIIIMNSTIMALSLCYLFIGTRIIATKSCLHGPVDPELWGFISVSSRSHTNASYAFSFSLGQIQFKSGFSLV